MCAFHDGASSEAGFAPAPPAAKNTGAGSIAIRLAGRPAVRTDESVAPTRALKVGRACRFVRKQPLELRQAASSETAYRLGQARR